MMVDFTAIVSRLKERLESFRTENDIPYEELGQRIGINQTRLNRLLQRDEEKITLQDVCSIANGAFHGDISQIFSESPDEGNQSFANAYKMIKYAYANCEKREELDDMDDAILEAFHNVLTDAYNKRLDELEGYQDEIQETRLDFSLTAKSLSDSLRFYSKTSKKASLAIGRNIGLKTSRMARIMNNEVNVTLKEACELANECEMSEDALSTLFTEEGKRRASAYIVGLVPTINKAYASCASRCSLDAMDAKFIEIFEKKVEKLYNNRLDELEGGEDFDILLGEVLPQDALIGADELDLPMEILA